MTFPALERLASSLFHSVSSTGKANTKRPLQFGYDQRPDGVVTQRVTVFNLVRAGLYVCAQDAVFAGRSKVDFLALSSEVGPTLDWQELL